MSIHIPATTPPTHDRLGILEMTIKTATGDTTNPVTNQVIPAGTVQVSIRLAGWNDNVYVDVKLPTLNIGDVNAWIQGLPTSEALTTIVPNLEDRIALAQEAGIRFVNINNDLLWTTRLLACTANYPRSTQKICTPPEITE
jgi:hypothetical protein